MQGLTREAGPQATPPAHRLPTMRMTVSTAALSFLVLAAAFGSQARVIDDTETKTLLTMKQQFEPPIIHEGFHQPAECCFSYISRAVRCARMEDYFETSSGCSHPGVIFHTKKGQRHICANPQDRSVQYCMMKLRLSTVAK